MTTPGFGRPIEILLVEDDAGDIRLTEVAFDQAKIKNRLSVVRDGEQAMAFLRREGEFSNAQRPDVILLDLNMPRKSGFEVLADLKADVALQSIPVVVLTSSDADQDIAKSYQSHANCYIKKPVDFEQFLEVVQSIESFWLCVVTLPSPQA